MKTQQVDWSRGQTCEDIELDAYLAKRWVRCLWCWTSASPTTVLEVALTLVLTTTGYVHGHGYADYSMYSTFLTASPGSVLFSRSTLLKRKDLCFSCLRLGLIRHRRSKKPHTFSQSTRHDFSGDPSSPPARSLVCALWRRLSLRLYSPFLKVPLIYH